MTVLMNIPKIKMHLFENCLDHLYEQALTPFIRVYSAHPKFSGTHDYEDDKGYTVFSLGVKAVQELEYSEFGISFYGKFNGTVVYIFVPAQALVMVYAKEDPDTLQPFLYEFGLEPEKPTKLPTNIFKPRLIKGGKK